MFFDKSAFTPISQNERLYYINASVLAFTKQWKFNRPSDPNRVSIIKDTILNGDYVVGVIYLADINGELVCYDGNHRREAIKFFPDKKIFINIIFNADDKIVEKRFRILNSSNPVSDLYMENTENIQYLQMSVSSVVKRFCELPFSVCSSTSARCKKPYFNRDTFENYLYGICKDNQLTLSGDELFNLLMNVNDHYKRKHSIEKFSATAQKKIIKSGLYLFVKGLQFEDSLLYFKN